MLLQEIENSWDPWRQLDQIQDALAQTLWDGRARSATLYPMLNAWTNDHEAIVRAVVPGMDPEKLEIQVVGDLLTLRGQRESEALQENQTWLRRERPSGTFSRSLQLPFHVDSDRVSARARNGILTITLPRAEQEKPRKIAVKSI